ncbi:hypothetical protein E4188_22610 (plasmid) [Aeromonas media]|uniref:Uncharacterized protein n=1 Tax=Aeromonas media TaxID=651 RepID=A0ABX6NY31_AERME|nr:hypothetical protein [Aeromonas media]QJT37104.1 hypothetical protein E4187_22710 [Aeromonas media]QJT41293.1 hypothetical protein E4188_22610 [Aeromonas media]
MKEITPERDCMNIKLITGMLLWASAAKRTRLLRYGTPEERDIFVKKEKLKVKFVVLGIGLWIIASELFPSSATPVPPPSVTIIQAGQIVGVELHDTTFSTSTSVTTTTGIYQVKGGVSAAKGDLATIKKTKERGHGMQTSLCIESKIKSGCYAIM